MYIFPFLSSISLPETFHAIMKKTTSEVRWRKANITKADFLRPNEKGKENVWLNWFIPSTSIHFDYWIFLFTTFLTLYI